MNFNSILRMLCTDKPLTDPVLNEGCDYFEVNNWIVSQFVLKKLVPIVGFCPFPLNEQMLMVAAVCRLQPTHIFEWGTNIGKSARIFYEVCKEFGLGTEIHSIDLPEDIEHIEHPREKRGRLVKGLSGITLHTGDGLDTSMQIFSQVNISSSRPMFFLDGDHGYSSVKRELEHIIKHVPNVNILLHDTFNQSKVSGYNVGPYKAMVDVLKATNRSFNILSQNMGLPGMTLLWQPFINKIETKVGMPH